MKKAMSFAALLASMIISMAFISYDDKDGNMVPVMDMPGTAPAVSFTALTSDNKILMYDVQVLNTPLVLSI